MLPHLKIPSTPETLSFCGGCFFLNVPPCTATTARRHLTKLVDIDLHSQTQALTEYDTVSSDVFTSKFRGLTLPEYCAVRDYYCRENHNQIHCTECKSMIQAAEMVLKNGIVSLAVVIKPAFPTVTTLNAKRRCAVTSCFYSCHKCVL